MSGVFVAGTDTGVGKTLVSLALLHLEKARGRRVAAMKPVASGCIRHDGVLRNEDALLLQAAANTDIPYDWVNPYAFAPPIAPHIAAAEAGVSIDAQTIRAGFARLAAQADWVLVEGVGGWLVPLGDTLSAADLPRLLNLPVVLVVGLRLGCLNHALLSAEAIAGRGLRLAGWVANQVDPAFARVEENLATLDRYLDAPCLGHVPFLEYPEVARIARCLRPVHTPSE